MEEEKLFEQIVLELCAQNEYVTAGKMMSSPGIKYKNKVFTFFHNEEMTFKLGKNFIPKEHGINEYSLLSPFKNKPPLAGWFCIPNKSSNDWRGLAAMALQRIEVELG